MHLALALAACLVRAEEPALGDWLPKVAPPVFKGAAAPAAAPAKPAPRVVRLLQADLSDKELAFAAERLESVFQLFVDNRSARKPREGVSPPGEPHLKASCSGSHLGGGVLATAAHCVKDASGPRVWRRWKFRARGGRLIPDGFEDFVVEARPFAEFGDLVLLRHAAAAGVPALARPESSYEYPAWAAFFALGYPNKSIGEPVVSTGCGIRP
ncbi:MAG: hypothetical protein HY925_07565, partial [Elusimicrobia bacterium]|nr:hypothetical protein [Elusimicrobiota bacterium]